MGDCEAAAAAAGGTALNEEYLCMGGGGSSKLPRPAAFGLRAAKPGGTPIGSGPRCIWERGATAAATLAVVRGNGARRPMGVRKSDEAWARRTQAGLLGTARAEVHARAPEAD